jgi:hypothetical protein
MFTCVQKSQNEGKKSAKKTPENPLVFCFEWTSVDIFVVPYMIYNKFLMDETYTRFI